MEQKTIDKHHHQCEANKVLLADAGHKGEWNDEPNRLNWKHAGLDCMIVRHTTSLHLCGYVGVPPTHPAFGKDYDAVCVIGEDGEEYPDIHGGLTYAKACNDAICHIAEDEDKTWWFGFDCAHSGDTSPSSLKYSDRPSRGGEWGETYKTIDFVRFQTNKLAEQLGKTA
jgi:hypothetical protein